MFRWTGGAGSATGCRKARHNLRRFAPSGLRKGEELGYFQYGGSTYCMFFQPGVVDAFVVQPPFAHDTPPVRVNAALARARERR